MEDECKLLVERTFYSVNYVGCKCPANALIKTDFNSMLFTKAASIVNCSEYFKLSFVLTRVKQ